MPLSITYLRKYWVEGKENRSDEFFLHECGGRQIPHIGILCCGFVALHRTKIISSLTILRKMEKISRLSSLV